MNGHLAGKAQIMQVISLSK